MRGSRPMMCIQTRASALRTSLAIVPDILSLSTLFSGVTANLLSTASAPRLTVILSGTTAEWASGRPVPPCKASG